MEKPAKKENPSNPKGVGQSDLRRGEDIKRQDGKEAGRFDTERKGQSQRPTGKSTPRDITGIAPEKLDEKQDDRNS